MGNRKYSKNHIWIEEDGALFKIGISDYAQKKLGSVMFLNLPDVGDDLESGKKFGDIESIKTVSDLISPIDGTVAEINEDLLDEPDAVNDEAETAWFVKAEEVKMPEDLLLEEQYKAYCETL